MSVILRKRKLADGRYSLFLDIHNNGTRVKEYLQIYLKPRPKDLTERNLNKDNLLLAENIRAKRELAIHADEYDYSPAFKRNARFNEYFHQFSKDRNTKDKRKALAAYTKFASFTNSKPVTFRQVTEVFATEFKEYLIKDAGLTGETPHVYFSQFKKAVKKAYREKLLKDNPVSDVTIYKTTSIHKDVLTMDEIGRLFNSYCGNEQVKRGFLFSCLTGLRFCDITRLTWGNVKETKEGMMVEMKQSKTDRPVKVNLNADARHLMGVKGGKKDLVFKFPSHTAVRKLLSNWAEKAKIDKHLTYHVSRHSFGTNLIYHGTDVKTVSELMGHSSLNYTTLYLHISESMKQTAVHRLPSLKQSSGGK